MQDFNRVYENNDHHFALSNVETLFANSSSEVIVKCGERNPLNTGL